MLEFALSAVESECARLNLTPGGEAKAWDSWPGREERGRRRVQKKRDLLKREVNGIICKTEVAELAHKL